MRAIHQFVPMLHEGDAVGRHTVAVQAELQRRGVDSAIYVDVDDPATVARTRRAADYASEAREGDLLVYQLATASSLADLLAARHEPLVVNYHNITPPEFFAHWDNALARHQALASFQRAMLAGRTQLGVAVSEYNRADLVAAGYPATAVVPLAAWSPLGGAMAPEPTDPVVTGEHPQPRRRGARWLAVGRVAPNKALEEGLLALLAYRLRHDPDAHLVLVGRNSFHSYQRALHRFAADLGLTGAVDFVGPVSEAALWAAYAEADALLVVSRHEGFCMPVVEAMAQRLPVLARRRAALPEVLGEAGVLLDGDDPEELADAAWRLQVDESWRHQVVEAGRRRLIELDLDGAAGRLVDHLLELGDPMTAAAPR